MQNVITDKRVKVEAMKQMPVTVALIGKAIRDSSSYLPIRNLAASLAATAPRKNFPMQVKAIWDYFLKRWRYVKDPHGQETLTTAPRAVYNLVMGHNGGVGGLGFGAGDCDDATVGLGALLMAAGFPVRIGTTAPPGHPGLGFTHVFPQVFLGDRWFTVDPVLVPNAGIGDIAPHGRLGIWDLKGNLIATRGVSTGAVRRAHKMQGR